MIWLPWQLSLLAIINLGVGVCFGYLLKNYEPKNNVRNLNEQEDKCSHKTDGKFYNLLGEECDVGNTLHFKVKCKKCGEFYR